MPHFKRPGIGSQARLIRAGVGGPGERALKRQVNGKDRVATYAPAGKLPEIIEAFEKARKASSKAEIVALINDGDLPREAIHILQSTFFIRVTRFRWPGKGKIRRPELPSWRF